MTDQEALRIIAEMGPEVSDAFNSWMSLQWAGFWADKAIFAIFVIAVFVGVKHINR